MFALGLKATGSYLCRSLSYSGAEFELENCALSDEMSAMYDRSCAFWQMLHNVFNTAASGRCSEGRKVEKSSSVKWAQFWGSHQRFFRQMLLSAKVPHLAKLALEHVHTRNMSVVIGLQSTGESNIGQAMEQMAANGEVSYFNSRTGNWTDVIRFVHRISTISSPRRPSSCATVSLFLFLLSYVRAIRLTSCFVYRIQSSPNSSQPRRRSPLWRTTPNARGGKRCTCTCTPWCAGGSSSRRSRR